MRVSADLNGSSPRTQLPPELAEVLRPELGSLAVEIVHDVRKSIPEYDRPLDGPYGRSIRAGVEYALTLFVDQIADPSTSKAESLDVHRTLGRQEMCEGRSLDRLLAAYRLGARVAWRRLMDVGKRAQLSSAVMSELADAMLGFMDELASVAFDGYLEAKSSMPEAVETWRRQLLALIMERPSAPPAAIAELAQLIGWMVPGEACAVAVEPRQGAARHVRPDQLDHDVLAELDDAAPHLLISGPMTDARLAALQWALPGRRLAVGPCVALESAAESLRLARAAFALAADGTIPKQRVTWAERHLSTLLLHADDTLLTRLRQRWFAKLDGLTPKQRERVTTTLRAWLDSQGAVPEIAEQLGVHTQTVRYRVRQLEATFGEHLHDPDARFEMALVLRARPRDGRTTDAE